MELKKSGRERFKEHKRYKKLKKLVVKHLPDLKRIIVFGGIYHEKSLPITSTTPIICARDLTRGTGTWVASLPHKDICGCDPSFVALVNLDMFVDRLLKQGQTLTEVAIVSKRGQHRSVAAACHIRDFFAARKMIDIVLLDKSKWTVQAQSNWDVHQHSYLGTNAFDL
jgi:hypothetical protein